MANRPTSSGAGDLLSSTARRSLRLANGLGLAALVVGCATAYQPHGLSGGFEESQVNENSFRVSFRGNGYTSTNRAEELTLLRSAELCLERGFPAFLLLRERTDIKNESLWMSNSSYRRGNVFSTGTNLNFSMPSTSNLVSCIAEKPSNVFSYDAVVLYESLTTKYQVPRSAKFSTWKDTLSHVRISPVQESSPAAQDSALARAPQPTQVTLPTHPKDWQTNASAYSRSIGCSVEPTKYSFTAQGAEQYEFACSARPALKLECWSISGGCRRLPTN